MATDRTQRDVDLLRLVKYANSNGVHDLRIVSKEEIADPYSNVYEPNVECSGGVYSPSTGIVDSHMVMMSLLGEAEECGAMLALNSRVKGGEVIKPSSSSSSGGGEGSIMLTVDGVDIACDNVIVCAGLASDKIASSIVLGKTPNEIDDMDKRQQQQQQNHHNNNHFQKLPKQYYAKGNYFKLENQKSPFTRLIYPLPDPNGGLGVHATIDLAGSTRFGPDVEWLPPDINLEDIDMTVDPKRADSFYDAVRRYWPELGDGNLVPDYSGIRPKLMHPQLGNGNDGNNNNNNNNTHLTDFLIAGREYHGVKGLIVLLGMESPGLTSSLAIGDYVARIIE